MKIPRVPSASSRASSCRSALARPAIAALGLLLACGTTEDAPPTRPLAAPTVAAPVAQEEGVKIVVLGDSISAGLGLAVDRAFPAVVEDMLQEDGLQVKITNAGVSGDTSTAGAARVAWLLKQSPDVLVVELGGNDLLRGQPVAVTQAKLAEIVQAGVAAGAEVVLLGITAPTSVGPDHKAAFDAIYPQVAEQHGARLVPDFLGGLMGRPELLQADGLHPTAEGQRVLAEALAPVLRELVQAPSP